MKISINNLVCDQQIIYLHFISSFFSDEMKRSAQENTGVNRVKQQQTRKSMGEIDAAIIIQSRMCRKKIAV